MSLIRKLPPEVVQRIAAGEIIQRPHNAVKELLENSLDAGATHIQISVKNGGFSLLQVSDDGSGIRKEDLEIVCQRFTTSKIKSLDDLMDATSFGFRGEALSAISTVANVEITTRTADSECSYKADYREGVLLGEPQPFAGNVGTKIKVSNMFLDLPSRRNAIGENYNEEFLRIMNVVIYYAVQFHHVSFSCRKEESSNAEVQTIAGDRLSVLRQLNPSALTSSLKKICFEGDKISMEGFISAPEYVNKKTNLILFLNNRLVSNQAIKKTVETAFSKFAPKGCHPWCFLSIQVPPRRVDVNIHPTKREVRLLDEDEITATLASEVSAILQTSSEEKEFSVTKFSQTQLKRSSSVEETPSTAKKIAVHKLKRVDTKDQTLEEVLKRGLNFQPRTWVTVRLTSVLRLRKECADKSDPVLGEMFKDVKFVGKLSENHLLFQHNIGLYCVNIPRISELMFYQLFLHYFHNLEEFVLDPPIKLEMKLEKLQMMKEYFSIHIDEDSGRLVRLPVVIKGHKPNLSRIDRFIENLANPDIWDDEMVCFRAIITALSQLYKVDDLSVFSDLDFLIDQLKLIKIPSHVFSDGDIKELASLSNLYKIFERC